MQSGAAIAERADRRRRGHDPEAGAGLVLAITVIFAVTFGGLVWLARDVDRSVSNRSTASSIAFQAARSGAQAARISDLRGGREPTLDPAAAHAAAVDTATRLLRDYKASGTVDVDVGVDRVTATVSISEAGRTVTGVATVEARRVP